MKWSELAVNISAAIIAAGLLFIIFWFRNYFAEKLWLALHFVIAILGAKRYVLIWNDDSFDHSERIGGILAKQYARVTLKALSTPRGILNFPSNPSIVKAIILIVSDTTKLSEEKNIKDRIQNWLVTYLYRGGGIIGTHDVIYSRVRNQKLEEVFGGQITDFKRTEGKVKYVRNPDIEKHEILRELPDSFELDDGEVLWGNWRESTTCIFQTEGENPKPLVVAREFAKGRVVWLNSGDKREEIAKSILSPEEHFVILLRNALDWTSGKH